MSRLGLIDVLDHRSRRHSNNACSIDELVRGTVCVTVNIPLAAAEQGAADRNVDVSFLRGSRKPAGLPQELLQRRRWLIPLGVLRSRGKHEDEGQTRQGEFTPDYRPQPWSLGARSFSLHLDHLVGAGDEGDEERQHHVDEQGDEGVEVGPAEVPHQAVLVFELREGGEHVVAVQQREQTLGHAVQLLELESVGSR